MKILVSLKLESIRQNRKKILFCLVLDLVYKLIWQRKFLILDVGISFDDFEFSFILKY